MSLKKYLNQYPKEELILQITELHKKFKDVKSYYEVSMNPNSIKVKEEAKKKITKCFSLNINVGAPLNLREARKIITDFKKLSLPDENVIDLMLHYVERGIIYTNSFGDIDMPFYNSVAGMSYDACMLIQKNNLQGSFNDRCLKMCKDTKGIGWGFHDELCFYYEKFIQPKK